MKHALLLFALAAAPLLGHPSVSVVRDPRGNVYFSDLKQVWRVAPDGKKTVAVAGVHTHELAVDAEGNLYGEHLWYEGEKVDKWGHYVWRMAPDGAVTQVYPPRQGFRGADFFVREAATHRVEGGVLQRRRPKGGWAELARVGSGKRHAVMGFWPSPDGAVLVAVPAERSVKRVAPDGAVTVVATSRYPWMPTGGMLDATGALWVLEWNVVNHVRLRRIAPDGKETLY
jgi:hypothetical protein